MAFKLIIFGALWLMAIGMITTAAFLYFREDGSWKHEREMWKLKNREK